MSSHIGSSIIILGLLFFLFYAAAAAAAAAVEVKDFYPDERNGLKQIRDILNSTFNMHSNWTGPPCHKNQSRWAGVACFNGHVIHLVLEGIQLTGSLPPSFLQNITLLTKLSFRNNSLRGPLPLLSNLLHLEFVFLSQNRFSGSIPKNYVDLAKLKILELEENSIDGSIPPFDQQTLVGFNVSYNNLEGSIPETSVLSRFPPTSFLNNSKLCGKPLGIQCHAPSHNTPPSPSPSPSPTPSAPKSNKKGFNVRNLALILAAALLIPLFVMLLFLCYYKRFNGECSTSRTQKPGEEGSEEIVEKRITPTAARRWSESAEDPERRVELEFFDKDAGGVAFDLDDLLRASAEVLGRGNLGTAYKATLESGPTVVVKRIKEMNALSKKDFVQQMQLIGRMRHENLVDIKSFYYSSEEKLIIYEFVPHSNLYDLLHGNRGIGRMPLNWTARVSIIKDIAKGLDFLHQSCPSHKVPHGNLKSSNVLVVQQNSSQEYRSKLTDFGFYPLLPSRKSSSKLAIGRSPEFAQGKKLTHRTDVYCFGIVLLEVITGKIPGENGRDSNDDLSDWVSRVVTNDWSTDILDVELLGDTEEHDEMLKLTKIALDCTDVVPEKRPKMSQVLRRIQDIEKERTTGF